jgi:hypothetical protein
MAACEKCGAQLAPYTPRCNYCNTVTAYGAAQQAEQERYRAATEMQAAQVRAQEEQRAKWAAQAEVTRSAESAFNWSLVGLFLCCLPILPIVAIVMGFRSRALALSRGLLVPSKAWLAMTIGAGSLCGFAGMVVLTRHLEAEKADRKARVEKALGKHAADAKPSIDDLCRITELWLLDNAFAGDKLSDGTVNCDASKWSQTDDAGELTGIRFRAYETSQEKIGNVCFSHGSKWVVDTVVTTSCGAWREGKTNGSAKSGEPSAAASSKESAPPAEPTSSAGAPAPKKGR